MLALVVTGYQAFKAATALEAMKADVTSLREDLAGGRGKAAEISLSSLQDHAGSAHSNTRGPVWWLGSQLPFVGDDVSAVRTVSAVSDDLATTTLPRLVDAALTVAPQKVKPVDGRIPLEPIESVAPDLRAAADEMAAAQERLDPIDPADLSSLTRDQLTSLLGQVSSAVSATDSAADAAELLPGMLGRDGRRTYLAVFQNNAEIRSTGGHPGAVAIITADRGRIEMVRNEPAQEITFFDDPVLPVTKEERALFTEKIATNPLDPPLTPDFPRVAEIFQEMWRRSEGQTVDGVIAADPTALAKVLEGVGQLQGPYGEPLNHLTVVSAVLNNIYLVEPDLDRQNDYFSSVARLVFDAMASGQGDMRTSVRGLASAASARRFLVWSARDEEQAVLAGSSIAGALPTEDSSTPEIGVYVNNGAADKMSYYLDYEVDVVPRICNGDGSQVIDVTVRMRSKAPDPDTLPDTVAGYSTGTTRRGDLRNSFYIYAPVSGRFDDPELDGEEAPLAEFTHQGRRVGVITLDLRPGQKHVVEVEVRTHADQRGTPRLLTTPGALVDGRGLVGPSACG